ncbi:hypothetical protein E5676_scaffold562G00450 [Cucumis melo var. makuwa]|uniref:Uncharacterized protein n=1 Tax=Cucumis melo var. makuwa TaxID=1194695 RepID=A0A5D3BK36_CUCMM|nr:hypothetical protein E5676_scaffold562G00450 [Cucumis melo var. makuwa]
MERSCYHQLGRTGSELLKATGWSWNYCGEASSYRQDIIMIGHATLSSSSFMEALFPEDMQRNDDLLQSQSTSIRNLELQLGQLASDFFERL